MLPVWPADGSPPSSPCMFILHPSDRHRRPPQAPTCQPFPLLFSTPQSAQDRAAASLNSDRGIVSSTVQDTCMHVEREGRRKRGRADPCPHTARVCVSARSCTQIYAHAHSNTHSARYLAAYRSSSLSSESYKTNPAAQHQFVPPMPLQNRSSDHRGNSGAALKQACMSARFGLRPDLRPAP